jgi:phenylpropionate dioxygenase-like ring-hydroxylating dioxygenase large terminal subunit
VIVTNASPWLAKAWHPVLRASDLGALPIRVVVLGVAYVLVRLDGHVVAFDDRCPHRNARLSQGIVVEGCLQCPYHGWRFNADGLLREVPALGPDATVPSSTLTGVAVTERFDHLWIAPGAPVAELPTFAEWDDPSLTATWLPSVTIRAGAAQFIDNFLDFAHFPFVHAGTFGAGESALLEPFSVSPTSDGWGASVDITHTIANHEDPLVATGAHPLVQARRMRFTYSAPFVVLLRLDLPLTGVTNAILTFVTPVDDTTTIVHTAMLRNDITSEAGAAEAIAYERAVLDEDLAVIEFLPDTALDLRPTAQLHTRADRLALEYRRLLRALAEA